MDSLDHFYLIGEEPTNPLPSVAWIIFLWGESKTIASDIPLDLMTPLEGK